MFLRSFVRNGAIWLDKYDPTWHQRIVVNDLANHDSKCVLGQLYGDAQKFIEDRYFVRFDDNSCQVRSTASEILHLPLYIAAIWFMVKKGFVPTRDPEVVWKNLWVAEVLKRQVGTSAPIEQKRAPTSECTCGDRLLIERGRVTAKHLPECPVARRQPALM